MSMPARSGSSPGRARSATSQVLVEPTAQGAELLPRTSALNEALPRNSGLDIPGLVSLTRQMRDLTDHLRGDEDS